MVNAVLLHLCWLIVVGMGQSPLVINGGFEQGQVGWSPVAGAYGKTRPGWAGAGVHAALVGSPVHNGKRALRLDAVGLPNEVDAYSNPVQVSANHGYRLTSYVRQMAGTDSYKVTIDWQTGQGKHLKYDNDWRGTDRPVKFVRHGGVFAAPADAARAVIILGVQKGTACVFDDISLDDLGQTEAIDARPRHDGDGSIEIVGPGTGVPPSVDAGAGATWRAVYTCGPSGLPVGGGIVLRRYPVSFDWSPPQGSDPHAAGYVSVKGPAGAQFDVQAGPEQSLIVRLEWPALAPGDRVEIVIGDRSAGGPGMRVQRKPVSGAHWFGGSDCTLHGEWRDLSASPGGEYNIVPGAPAALRVVAPSVWTVGVPCDLRIEAVDRAGNVTGRYEGVCELIESSPGFKNQRRLATVRFGAGDHGVRTVSVRLSEEGPVILGAIGGRLMSHAAVAVVAARPPAAEMPQGPRALVNGNMAWIASARVGLMLRRAAGGWAPGDLFVRSGDHWRKVGAIPDCGAQLSADWVVGVPFLADTVTASGGSVAPKLVLTGHLPEGRFVLTYSVRAASDAIEMRLQATPAASLRRWAVRAPILYAGDGCFGDRKAGALFPGLEFLTADERSSDDAGVAWAIHKREIPHPYKITVPLMAVAGDKSVVILAWDPNQKWDGVHSVPLAQFASPNFLEHRPNHLMALWAPGFGAGFHENDIGYSSGGRGITLSAELMALDGTEDVVDAVKWWSGVHPLPAARPPRTPAEGLDLSARGFLDVAWQPAKHGWVGAIGTPPGFQDSIACDLLQIANITADGGLASRARAQAMEAIAAVGGPRGAGLDLKMGDAELASASLRQGAYGFMATQHADGSWAFHDIFSTEGARAGLAMPDDVELGTCVSALDPVLAYAVATGDPRAASAGLRGLEYIRRFRKPAGAESWEVPLVCPNLRAAALACRCWLRGWQLTGKDEYLDQARRWAWAGAAFIYHWQAPDRPAMPGASISVMGTTYYESAWFGWAVQWVGLVYADVLQEFARYDRSYDWHALAALITASAEYQQKTPSAPCGHVGLFPDSFSMLTGKDSYEWCLAPNLIVDNLMGLIGRASGSVVAQVPAGGPIHVLSPALIPESSWDAATNTLTLRLHHHAGETAQVVVYGLQGPCSATWNGSALAEAQAGGAGIVGNVKEKALIFRLHWDADEETLAVHGQGVTAYGSPQVQDKLLNGGFEEGMAGWQCEPDVTIDTSRPHTGKSALLISSPDAGHERQAVSAAFGVEGGARYRLSAWVWQVEGTGDYKVTVEWLGPDGSHVAYDNDWLGTNRPAVYTLHGGEFVAPPSAASAHIILGCRGAHCLFDDVALEPAR
jgi:hypothetical protein